MNCQNIQELLAPFLEGRLHGDDGHQVRRHLASCEACRSGLSPQDLMEILPVLDETIDPSENFESRFYARLNESRRRNPKPTRWKWPGSWGWSWRLATAGVLTVAVAAGLFFRQSTQTVPDSSAVFYELDVTENLPILKDMALISDLELFEDLDTIENLPQSN
jgi:predicted anti-sigma-YlaC factor YlaD